MLTRPGVRRAADALAFGAGRPGAATSARTLAISARIAASRAVKPSKSASEIIIKATPAAVTISGKTAAKVVRKPVTKNGKSACSGGYQIADFCHRSL